MFKRAVPAGVWRHGQVSERVYSEFLLWRLHMWFKPRARGTSWIDKIPRCALKHTGYYAAYGPVKVRKSR